MGLLDVVQRAAQTAIGVVGNIAESATYTSLTYTNGQASGSTTLTVHAVRIDFDVAKVDGVNVLAQDRQYLIAGLDLGTIVPSQGDTLTLGAEVWTVRRVQTDPAAAAYLMQVRR